MKPSNISCAQCEEFFTARRAGNKYCSNRCRLKHFRRYQEQKLEFLESLIKKLPDEKPQIIDDCLPTLERSHANS